VDFSGRSARLAVIPEGHQFVDAVFSPDGRHVAFVTTRDGNSYVHLDGKQGRPYEAVRGLVFRPGHATLAYVASRGTKETLVVDGQEDARHGGLGHLRFAADGRVVSSARRGETWAVVAGHRDLPVTGDADPVPVASPGGRRVVFRDRRPDSGQAGLTSCSIDLTDCLDGASFDTMGLPILDPSGGRVAFVAGRAGRETVVVADLDEAALGGRTLGWYDAVALLGLSDGGQHVAFLARRGQQQLLVRDGQELPLPETDSPMVLEVSRTGRVAVISMRAGKVVALVDGRPAGPGLEEVSDPTFSPDGLRLAYVAGGASMNLLMVDDARGPTMDRVVKPRFMPVGSGVVYRARRGDERFVVQANARAQTIREHPHYQAVFDFVFSPDGRQVGYGVRQGRELWWKVEKLEGTGPG
jgi:Tol biopolymer transport system component